MPQQHSALTCRMPATTRRRASLWLAGGIAASMVPGIRTAMAAPQDTTFDVYRKGSRIGVHEMRFTPSGDGLSVSSNVELAVKMAFVTVYRYAQAGTDEWQGGMLVGTRIETDDDGKKTLVVAQARGGKLAVEGPTKAYETDLGSMTDLSFWNDAITGAPPLIDSQTGELIRMAVQTDTTEVVQVLGQPVEARRYEMAATKGRSGTVWYDSTARLVKAVVVTRGETLNYELAA